MHSGRKDFHYDVRYKERSRLSQPPTMAFELTDFQASRCGNSYGRKLLCPPTTSSGRPKSKPAPKDEALVARIDPELDEIQYGGTQHDGKSVADTNGLNVHLWEKFQVQFLEDNPATITIITKGE